MEAVAHLLPQSVVAAKTLAQHQLGNGGNVGRFKNSLGQGFRHLSAPGRPPLDCILRVLRKESVTSPLGTSGILALLGSDGRRSGFTALEVRADSTRVL